LLDAVNLLYVAMTRPEERLFVFSPAPPEKTDKAATVPAFLSYYLKDSGLGRRKKDFMNLEKLYLIQRKLAIKTIVKKVIVINDQQQLARKKC